MTKIFCSCYIFVLAIIVSNNIFASFQQEKVSISLATSSEKIEALERVFDEQIQRKPKEAINTANQLLNYLPYLPKESEKSKAIIASVQLSKHAYITGEFDSAFFWAYQVIPYYESFNDSISLIKTYRSLGTSFFYENEFDSASYYYIKATNMAEKLNAKEYLLKLYMNLAIVYGGYNKSTVSQDYYLKALDLAKEAGDKMQQIKICFNISTSLYNDEDYSKALAFAQEAVELSRQVSFNIGLYRSLDKEARVLLAMKKPLKALKALEEAMRLEVTDPIYEKEVKLNYSRALIESGKYQAAKDNIYNSIKGKSIESESTVDKMFLETNFFKLSTVYSYLRNPDSATFFMNKAIDLNRQIENDKVLEATTEMQTKYETEKKEQEIIQLNQEKEISELKLRNTYYFAIGAVIIGILLAFGIWIFLRQKSIIDKFEKEQAKLRWRRAQLNPHFFFNVLSALQTLMYEKKTEEAIDYVAGFSILMRKVLEESNKEKASLEEEIAFLDNYLSLEKLSLDFDYEIRVKPEDLETEDILIPTMLLQPFVENAIEHGLRKSTKEEKQITIAITEIDQNTLQISVRDNGAGRSNERKKNHVSRALEITKDRKKLMKNSFDYQIIDHKDENENSLGTEAVFSIKI